ncbi:DUF6527 family protein [Pontibacter virosus]|uniref:Uncharacterized protein n=1 Tax=Pontibacter virosus TaxID=1765052 RepID=A0A2U1AWU8_9BACT|nr:DUF6527 family protein [Pontibacter virosus]PVY40873.1 hypothetical protein C8E01_106215 [Pontibacter virosus]
MKTVRHEFVEYIPEELEKGVVYISVAYGIVAHSCCCGCGMEVSTPLSPTDWKLTYDGESISLYPSIGNWNFSCKSHYWITNNRIKWAGQWSATKIKEGQQQEKYEKAVYYEKKKAKASKGERELLEATKEESCTSANGIWVKMKKWFFNL